MSDDLIKRNDAPEQIFASKTDEGWRWPRASKFPEQGPYENIRYIRADRSKIEQLERGMDALQDRLYTANKARADANFRANKKQFKLAKAVEAIKEIEATVASSKVPIAGLIRHQCKVALAELEGKENE